MQGSKQPAQQLNTQRALQIQVSTPPSRGCHTPGLGLGDATSQKHGDPVAMAVDSYVNLILQPKSDCAAITDAGRVAFLGESSGVSLLTRQSLQGAVHYPMPRPAAGPSKDPHDIENRVLQQRGAFLIPPRQICDELIDSYFAWIHPVVPIINQTHFRRQYRDPLAPPSMLLLQSIFLASTHVCDNMTLRDADGSTKTMALTFYKRAKAFYDANHETDRVAIIQSMILIGWYWGGREDVLEETFDWTRAAIIVAQGTGMHRSVARSLLSTTDKRLWKRIWWTLFTRDRLLALTLGRPMLINLADSDVEMIRDEDFNEDEPGRASKVPPNPAHVQFFLRYVALCEILGEILSRQCSMWAQTRFKELDMDDVLFHESALARWHGECPAIVSLDSPERDHFWAAVLHSKYYTTLCLLHRSRLSAVRDQFPAALVPSRRAAVEAAAMITGIIQGFSTHGQLRRCPSFIIYSLLTAFVIHRYQDLFISSTSPQAVHSKPRDYWSALLEISRTWPLGGLVNSMLRSVAESWESGKRVSHSNTPLLSFVGDMMGAEPHDERHVQDGLAAAAAAAIDTVEANRQYPDLPPLLIGREVSDWCVLNWVAQLPRTGVLTDGRLQFFGVDH
ncbi:cutinase transcription factor 1 alpha [Verticillium dahliae VdLs.17]|uniref:Cutinase transcription factor 1 alpha n=1 Tax=Verticillium dahliae (strain VdLs.17 / ATCC MYA-4575 / FGSC 10137) TaxID=498257 RepID=G2WYJ5_VERDV|nr:cutinase transcription factor 1 alpha [Verticillium dahliae VdLs.17]EGY21153.1 cutinase transcription factor 1 alpha [Verticillium dahliae VdLs.17]KAH6707131.1 cutinase transcription factor 1 alpha [Verticillium dahliae]